MSTPQPPSIWWQLYADSFTDPGSEWSGWRSNELSTWSEISDRVELDPGFQVGLVRQFCTRLRCGFDEVGLAYDLYAPAPCQFFTFTRYGQQLSPVERPLRWLYTVFGYALGDQVICARLHVPEDTPEIECLNLSRPVSFPW